MITVLILAYNELENIKKTVQGFRLFGDIPISMVVVDNGSTDGLREWIKDQTDLTYVYLDEGSMGWAKAINSVRKELQINTDVLIMEGHYVLTPRYLRRLTEVLYEDEDIGAVGGVCNEAYYGQMIHGNIHNYKEAVEQAGREMATEGKRAIMLDHGAILWKKDTLDFIGEFCEKADSMYTVMNDYCLRVVMDGRKLMVCTNAFLWKLSTESKNDAFEWEKDVMEEKWGIHYFCSYNESLIQLIENTGNGEMAVLEIGCANGGTLAEIKNRYPEAKVYGTELNVHAAAIAAHFAEATVNNIEDKNLPFHKNMFDYILFGDVLEHLHEPMEILKYCREFLREGGCIIASIPNVMHVSVIEQLLQGNFTYTEYGLLDKTHIHMFTYNEIIRTFYEAGYEIEKIGSNKIQMRDEQEKLIDSLLSLGNRTERFMYDTFQFVLRARVRNRKDYD